MARVLIVLLIAVGAVACGGGGGSGASSGSSGTSDSSSQSASPSAGAGSASGSESASASSGRSDAVSDLSEFVCEPDADGQWNASGVITNSSGQAADYRVTVVVSEGPGASLEGKRRAMTELAPDTPESFDIKRLPGASGSDTACQVQVLRLG